jgi:hypothetical protein
MDLSIIIINWKSREFLRACLQSLSAAHWNIEFEVLVLDNASYDGCGDMISADFPKVRFIQSELNLGFAKANNIAAEKARGNVLLFLNPDTVVERNAISNMLHSLGTAERAGLIGARLLNSDGTTQSSSILWYPTVLNQVFDCDLLERLRAQVESGSPQPVAVEAVSGAAQMIRKTLFDQIGGFSTAYTMYAEDIDLCWKVALAGWKVLHLPSAVITHFGGGSSSSARTNFTAIMMRESVYRFFLKHRGVIYAYRYRIVITLSALPRMAVAGGLLLAKAIGLNFAKKPERTFQKWLGILRWGIGLERWVRMPL